jgi:pSer/pThr/pTyr-binding forkhead associated (FHA) protein
MWSGVRQAPAVRHLDVILKPLSRPELGEIRIDAAVFSIGRVEQPFESYGNDVLNMLSRRHASIFRKEGFVYLVDLQSRNGTTVNRTGIGHEPCQLRDGDEICFGGSLSYRIQITPRLRPEGTVTLMLTPESGDSGLETIVISKFPFLVSKTDGIFAHYKSDDSHGAEVRFLSRRHAHIYQKGDQAYINDLGSANGTFIDGQKLQEQAVPLQDGALVAFGGKHFVYRVRIVRETGVEADVDISQHLTERRLPIQRQVPTPPPAAVAAKSPESPPPAPAAVPESKPKWGIFGRKSPPPVAVSPKADSQPPSPDANSLAAASPGAGAKPATPTPSGASGKPVSSAASKASSQPFSAVASKQPAVKPEKAPAAGALMASQPTPTDQAPVAEAKPRPEVSTSSGAQPQATRAEPTPQPQPEAKSDLNLLAMDSGTTFMAAPTSFLSVLCAADGPKKQAVPDPAAEANAKESNIKKPPRGRVLLLLSELVTLIRGEPDGTFQRRWKFAAIGAAVIVALAVTAYIWNANERAFKDAIARNDYPRAATIAVRLLDKHPDDIELRAKATEVGLKAAVPAWLDKIEARDFDAAKGVLASTTALSKQDTDLRPLFDELEWLGDLERLISVRGGPEAPIRIYADEDSIEHIVSRWNEDTGEHQRALSRIASYVPQFGDWYGEALTHLRRLQSESTVYLPVVERIKANITTELSRDNPDALRPTLEDSVEKYPRLGGIDIVRQDLARYTEIRHEARSRKSGRLFALLEKAHFATPPFQQSFHALVEGGQLPPPDLLKQYDAATRSWREHNPTDALAELQKLTTTGPWGEYLSRELERRGGVASAFSALQLSRSAPDYVDRLLTFRESLDPDEDIYFTRATAADLTQQKGQVIQRAQDAMSRARTFWQEYRTTGAIDASERIETTISDEFRSRAHSLAEANKYVQQAFQLYSLVEPAGATQWTAIRDEIQTEVDEQRSRLRDLSNVVEPALLNSKLALLGDANE